MLIKTQNYHSTHKTLLTKLTFSTRRKITVNRLIDVTFDTGDDVTTHQIEPLITLHCYRGIVGHWKLGGRS